VAKKKVVRRKKIVPDHEGIDQEIETDEEIEIDEDPTFAEAPDAAPVKKAKEVAQKKSRDAKALEPRATFYTMKGADKVVKVLVKHRGVYEIYLGRMLKKHKAALESMILGWKKKGEWVEPHAAKAKIEELRKALPPVKVRK